MKRNEKWALNTIFNEIKNEFDVRPFPVENIEITNVVHNNETSALNNEILKEIKSSFEEIAACWRAMVASEAGSPGVLTACGATACSNGCDSDL